MNALEQLFRELRIQVDRYEHPPVFTCEEAERWVPSMDAAPTKNLFLRDRKGRRHFLVVVGYEKSVDLKALSALLDVDRLVLGSSRRLDEYLGVEPGSVTILGLLNDRNRGVELVLDVPIAEANRLRCHPLVNTATWSVAQADLRRFLQVTGHPLRVLDIPSI